MPATSSKTGDHRIRILIVDDHAIVREGLRLLIESDAGGELVGEAPNRAAAIELAGREMPDLILLDLGLGSDSGLDLIPELRKVAPSARVLVLTGLTDLAAHRRALELGAVAVVSKRDAAASLLGAIHDAWNLPDPLVRSSIVETPPGAGPADSSWLTARGLTAREQEILLLVGEGLRNRQIGDRLQISEATVHHHLTSIYGKIGVKDRFSLIAYAYRNRPASRPR